MLESKKNYLHTYTDGLLFGPGNCQFCFKLYKTEGQQVTSTEGWKTNLDVSLYTDDMGCNVKQRSNL